MANPFMKNDALLLRCVVFAVIVAGVILMVIFP